MTHRAVDAGDERLRIIEVGAGYGSVTEHVLPVLRANDTYLFTDVSNFFLSRAADRFAQYPFLTFDHFDIELDPQIQGQKLHSYDVVIAASVMHNARNVPQALARLKSILVPGGILLLIEETSFYVFFDLGMGLQQGFGDFDDPDRPMHPLLSRDGWQRALADAGFARSSVLSCAHTIEDALGFDVVVAQAPDRSQVLNLPNLETYLLRFLSRSAVPSAWILLEQFPCTANGKLDRRSLSLPRHSFPSDRPTYVAPRNTTEKMLVEIWCKAMGAKRVGVKDDFFEMGGDSLVASRVVADLRNRFGVSVQLRTLFEMTTIESLATLINATTTPPPEHIANVVVVEL
jgi:pyochelin synthetase